MTAPDRAAHHMEGLELPGDWIVRERLIQAPDFTPGAFSVPYIVESSDGRRAFLKALDFAGALEAENPADEFARRTAEYEHERAILRICRDRRIKRVAVAMDEGVAVVPGFASGSRVNYFIFELAEGDARKHLVETAPSDVAWRLRSLHHIAGGLHQLHINKTAHQDVKPSNVLAFGADGWKLGDFGRASTLGLVSPHDECECAGDFRYAPFELLYREIDPDWFRRRCGCDAYLLGNLAFVFFTGVSLTAIVQSKLPSHLRFDKWEGTYREVLPFVRNAFDEVLHEFDSLVSSVSPNLAVRFVPAVRQLCEPDPLLRGDPKNRKLVATQYSLVRYVSLFDVLASRAEYGLN